MARNFPGSTGNYLDFGNLATANFAAASAWSWLGFFRYETVTDERTTIGKWGQQGNSRQALFRINTSNQTEVWTGGTNIITGAALSTNTWYLQAVRHASSSTTLLDTIEIDGTLVDNAVSGAAFTDAGNTSISVRIGEATGGGSQDPFDGDIAYGIYVNGQVTQQEALFYLRNPALAAVYFRAKYGTAFFVPILGQSTEPDWGGASVSVTVGGTVTPGDNPPVPISFGWDISVPYEVGGGGTTFFHTASATALAVPTLTRNVQTTKAATVLATPTLTRRVSTSRLATAIATPSLTKQIRTTKAATATGVATLSTLKLILLTLSTAAVGVASLTKQVQLTKAATSVAPASLVKDISITKSTTALANASLTKLVSTTKSTTAIGVSTLTAIKTFLLTAATSATGIATLTKQVGKTLGSVASTNVAILKEARTTHATSANTVPTLVKDVATTKAATATAVPTLTRAATFRKTFSAIATGVASLATLFIPGGPGGFVPKLKRLALGLFINR